MKAQIIRLVCAIALSWVVGMPGTSQAADKGNVDRLLLEAFKAEKVGGAPIVVAEKFQAVLQADPNNYYALVKLGILKARESEASKQRKDRQMEAVDYLLRATLAQPNNPEAYLYLADMHYRMGYVPEGDNYLRMSYGIGAEKQIPYDSICLLGQRYEDAMNLNSAILTYAEAALNPGSEFCEDPVLIERLYTSASVAPLPYDWAYDVYDQVRMLFARNYGARLPTVSDVREEVWKRIRSIGEDRLLVRADIVEALVQRGLRSAVVAYLAELHSSLKEQAGSEAIALARHEMPSLLFPFFFCDASEIPAPAFSDPLEAFAKASFDSPAEQQRVLAELRDLKDRAEKAVQNEVTAEGKAKKLFDWIKKNALSDYHVVDGYTAKGLVDKDKKRYICLSGTILYTLIANSLGLDVRGVIVPQHAYASFRDQGRAIRVETTADTAADGWDYKGSKRTVSFRAPFQVYGEVSDPMNLVAHQFTNTAVISLHDLVFNKYNDLFRRALRDQLGLEGGGLEEAVSLLSKYSDQGGMVRADLVKKGILPRNKPLSFSSLVRNMALNDNAFRQDLVNRLEKASQLLKKNRGLSPFDPQFKKSIQAVTLQAALYESLPAMDAQRKRDIERNKLMDEARTVSELRTLVVELPKLFSADSQKRIAERLSAQEAEIRAQMDKIDEEETQKWRDEQNFWMMAVDRLSLATREHPCDQGIKDTYWRIHKEVLALAEKQGDGEVMGKLTSSSMGIQ